MVSGRLFIELDNTSVGGGRAKILGHAKVQHYSGIDFGGKKATQLVTVAGTHPLIRGNITKLATVAE
ncbi:hypothetical protein D3C85_1627390 [compost metagenome]